MTTSKRGILVLLVFLCAMAAAQDQANPAFAQKPSHSRPTKVVRLHGQITADGKFVEDMTQKVWLITNVEMCKAYQGQQAVLRAQIASDASTIHVISISPQTTYTAHWSDSAFRR